MLLIISTLAICLAAATGSSTNGKKATRNVTAAIKAFEQKAKFVTRKVSSKDKLVRSASNTPPKRRTSADSGQSAVQLAGQMKRLRLNDEAVTIAYHHRYRNWPPVSLTMSEIKQQTPLDFFNAKFFYPTYGRYDIEVKVYRKTDVKQQNPKIIESNTVFTEEFLAPYLNGGGGAPLIVIAEVTQICPIMKLPIVLLQHLSQLLSCGHRVFRYGWMSWSGPCPSGKATCKLEETCSVCQQVITEGQMIKRMCGHAQHYGCIYDKSSVRCTTCNDVYFDIGLPGYRSDDANLLYHSSITLTSNDKNGTESDDDGKEHHDYGKYDEKPDNVTPREILAVELDTPTAKELATRDDVCVSLVSRRGAFPDVAIRADDLIRHAIKRLPDSILMQVKVGGVVNVEEQKRFIHTTLFYSICMDETTTLNELMTNGRLSGQTYQAYSYNIDDPLLRNLPSDSPLLDAVRGLNKPALMLVEESQVKIYARVAKRYVSNGDRPDFLCAQYFVDEVHVREAFGECILERSDEEKWPKDADSWLYSYSPVGSADGSGPLEMHRIDERVFAAEEINGLSFCIRTIELLVDGRAHVPLYHDVKDLTIEQLLRRMKRPINYRKTVVELTDLAAKSPIAFTLQPDALGDDSIADVVKEMTRPQIIITKGNSIVP